MPDTPRSTAALQALCADNTSGAITAQVLRDFIVSCWNKVDTPGPLTLKGSLDASASPNYPAGVKGDSYVVSVAGKVGGAAGKSVDVGDFVVASADNAGGAEGAVGASWFVLEHNLQGALLAANNLTDLTDPAAARVALGLASANTLPARPTLPPTPTGMTGYHRLAGPAGLRRYPTVGESPAVDVYGTVGVGTGRLGPCAQFNGTDALLHIGAKGGFNVCGGGFDWTMTFNITPDLWAGGVYTVFASQANGSNRAWEFRAAGGSFYFDWRDIGGTDHVGELGVPGGSVPAGSSTRVSVTYTSSTGALSTWINGAVINTVTTTGIQDYSALGVPINLPVVLGGRFDATNGAAGNPYWRQFTGRIEGFAVYHRVLSGAEQTALDTTDPTVPASGTTLFLDTPEPGDVANPDGAGAGTFRVQGWWQGSGTPTGWEYTWGDPDTWQTFAPTVSGQTFTALIPRSPAAGKAQRTLAVRWANDHTVASSAANVGVGPVVMTAGQSNDVGAGTALSACPASPDGYTASRLTHDFRVRSLDETASHGNGYYGVDRSAFIGSKGGDNGSAWPLLGSRLMTRSGRPCKFVIQGCGSTYITDWARDGTDPRNPSTIYGSLLLAWQKLPGAVRSAPLLLWWHGETDAISGTLQAAYQSALNTHVNNWHTDTGGKMMIFRLQHIGTGSDQGGLVRAAQDAVVAGNAYAVAGPDLFTANILVSVTDGVHVVSPSELARVAVLADGAMATAGF